MVLEALGLALAFFLGLGASRLGLPPLVGYLGAGFALWGLGHPPPALLPTLAEVGVLLLLFSLGLKLKLSDLMDLRILGVGALGLGSFALLAPWLGLPLALALAFSSTVMVVKVLEDKREVSTLHGRFAVGLLILQDLVAVLLMVFFGAEGIQPSLGFLLFLPLLRPLLRWLLDQSGHGEVSLLLGLLLALGGGELFRSLGLSPELGALAVGLLLSGHPKGVELGRLLWALREAFLVAFFLEVGWKDGFGEVEVGLLGLFLALALVKGPLLFFLALLWGLRARTAFVASTYLAQHSEFALIVGAVLGWAHLPTLALAVALSMALSAPLARYSHTLYRRLEPYLLPLERKGPHPDEEPKTLEGATVLVVGMGRTGSAVYRVLEGAGESPVGLDADPKRVARQAKEGLRVLYGDAEDPELWQGLDLGGLKAVVLALPDLEARLLAARWIRERGFSGLLASTSFYPEEDGLLQKAGVDLLFHPLSEAGERLGERVLEVLAIMGKVRYGRSQQVGPDQAQKGSQRP